MIKRLTAALFKNDLHISALQSIIKMQSATIDQLRKDLEWHKNRSNKPIIIEPPLQDPVKMDWTPLREAAELPSARRERLQNKFHKIAREKEKEMEKQ